MRWCSRACSTSTPSRRSSRQYGPTRRRWLAPRDRRDSLAILVLPRPLAIRPRFTPLSLVGGTALAILLLVVVFPILLIVVASFQPANAAQAGGLSIEPWKAALRDPGIGAAIRTTLSIVLLQQALSFPV